jgi:hypothetical protein
MNRSIACHPLRLRAQAAEGRFTISLLLFDDRITPSSPDPGQLAGASMR